MCRGARLCRTPRRALGVGDGHPECANRRVSVGRWGVGAAGEQPSATQQRRGWPSGQLDPLVLSFDIACSRAGVGTSSAFLQNTSNGPSPAQPGGQHAMSRFSLSTGQDGWTDGALGSVS